MGSQGGDSNSNGGTRTQTQTQIPTQDPKSNPLARSGSWYCLTLDEVQNQLGDLGKPLTSMNLDELLKTVFTVESNIQIPGGLDSGPVTQNPGQPGSSLNQPSSLTLSRDLSNKTVVEVWQNIQEEQRKTSLDRNTTLGEMTLEDFLVKAGVVAEASSAMKNTGALLEGIDSTNMPQAQWMNYQIHPINFMPGHPVQQPYPEAQMTMSSSPLMGNLSDTQTPGRKRVAPGDIVEKSVERRQKRMIKNRESAARSRARKQAYTHELENKVSRLEKENERLKRQKEWEKVLPKIPQQPQPKYQLRRTSSAPI